jgi:hypothetical protein
MCKNIDIETRSKTWRESATDAAWEEQYFENFKNCSSEEKIASQQC